MQSCIIRDFYLASLIIYNNIPLQSHERENGRTMFYFPESLQLKKLVDDYYAMKAEVKDILSFCGVIRNLKTIIHTSRATDQKISTIQHEGVNHEFSNQYGEKL